MNRRGFIAGLGALLAAPAIIRTPGLLMPVKRLPVDDVRIWEIVGSGGVVMPPAAAGWNYVIRNDSNASIKVFPPSGEIIIQPCATWSSFT